jgi:hypothetical protein
MIDFFILTEASIYRISDPSNPKNLDLSISNKRKKVIEPSIANHKKNIGAHLCELSIPGGRSECPGVAS